jgi:hypothetical protein
VKGWVWRIGGGGRGYGKKIEKGRVGKVICHCCILNTNPQIRRTHMRASCRPARCTAHHRDSAPMATTTRFLYDTDKYMGRSVYPYVYVYEHIQYHKHLSLISTDHSHTSVPNTRM